MCCHIIATIYLEPTISKIVPEVRGGLYYDMSLAMMEEAGGPRLVTPGVGGGGVAVIYRGKRGASGSSRIWAEDPAGDGTIERDVSEGGTDRRRH